MGEVVDLRAEMEKVDERAAVLTRVLAKRVADAGAVVPPSDLERILSLSPQGPE